MTDLAKLARKLERIGFGTKIEGENLIVYEGWMKDCLLILGVKTYKDGVMKRARQLEAEYGLKLVSCTIQNGISRTVFRGKDL
jgi:hypothetical protein